MCTLMKVSLSIIVIIILSFEIKAQHKSIADNLKDSTCDVYEMVVFQKDSNAFTKKFEYNIFLKQTGKQKTIEEYLNASTDYDKPKTKLQVRNNFSDGKVSLSLGSGVFFPSLSSNAAYNGGINFQFNAMRVMSNSHAIRGDFQFAHNTPTREYHRVEDGDLNTYAIKFNFLLGNFKELSKVKGYAILGGGINISKRGDTKFTYPEYDPYTQTYTGRIITYNYKYKADSYINLDLGGGLSYKISDKYKLYGEAQYTFPVFWMGRYAAPTLYGIFFGSTSLRVGAQIELL